MTDREELSTSFGAAAEVYESGRPEYPAEAVEWMLQPARRATEPLRVADVGAGTGKLARVVAQVGADVVAVDPDPEMLAVLRESAPGIPTSVGTAEGLPLPDASLDAVVLGQAWHWVDPVAGSLETARVLRPGGVLGLIWNIRDASVPWVRLMTRIMHGSHAEQMFEEGGPRVAAPFGDLEAAEWKWQRPMTRQGLLDMVGSRSYIITAPPQERARIDREIADLLDEIGAIADSRVYLPYVTLAYRAVRP